MWLGIEGLDLELCFCPQVHGRISAVASIVFTNAQCSIAGFNCYSTVNYSIISYLFFFFILKKIQTLQALGQDKMALSMSMSQEHIIFLLDCVNFTDGNLKEN